MMSINMGYGSIILALTLAVSACGGSDENLTAEQGDIDLAAYLFPESSTTITADEYTVSGNVGTAMGNETYDWVITGNSKVETDTGGGVTSYTVSGNVILLGSNGFNRYVDVGEAFIVTDSAVANFNISVSNVYSSLQLDTGTGVTGSLYTDVIAVTYRVTDKTVTPNAVDYEIKYYARNLGYVGEYERHCYIGTFDDQLQPDAACDTIVYDYAIRQ